MNGLSDMNDHFELVNVEKALNKQRNSSVSVVRHAMGDNAFDKDPFNQPELVFTLRGKELVIFVLGYIFAVLLILALFESVMPVYFVNDSQPFEVKE